MKHDEIVKFMFNVVWVYVYMYFTVTIICSYLIILVILEILGLVCTNFTFFSQELHYRVVLYAHVDVLACTDFSNDANHC